MTRRGRAADSPAADETKDKATENSTQPADASESSVEDVSELGRAGDSHGEGAGSPAENAVSQPAPSHASDSDADSASLHSSQPDRSAAADPPRPPAPPDEGPQHAPPVEVEPTRVRVMVNNLGPLLFKKGEVTSDPQIVKLLGDGTGRVELAESAE